MLHVGTRRIDGRRTPPLPLRMRRRAAVPRREIIVLYDDYTLKRRSHGESKFAAALVENFFSSAWTGAGRLEPNEDDAARVMRELPARRCFAAATAMRVWRGIQSYSMSEMRG